MGINDSSLSGLSRTMPTALNVVSGAAAPQSAEPAGKLPTDGLRIGATAEAKAGTLGWVKTQGSRLVDAQGKTVPVRGVNLGGWLVQEPWMMPLETRPKGAPEVKDQATMWREVERRFGTEEMQKLRDDYRSAWMTDEDFARIKAAGMNTVRLPFTYDTLQEPDGFKWLDWTIDRAARHGLYTVLDLHGAPGGQSDAMHTGQEGEPKFFSDPANIKKGAALWEQIARRYANRPEVLGYDLLNEPMGAKSAKELHAAHNELYQAIRKVDSKHVIFIEDGYKGIDTLPRKEKYGWDNIAYSVHQYKFGSKDPKDHMTSMERMLGAIDRVREARDVPVYVGEFNVPDAGLGQLTDMVGALEQADVPWSMWTYKVVMPGAAKNVWGLYRNDKASQTLDVTKDSPDELRRKMALMRTENLQTVPGEMEMLREVAAEGDAESGDAPPRRGLLASLALKVQDRVMTGVFKLVEAVRSRL
jgi:hypothetical protein